MFHYSFSTVLMAILASNILLILISICFQNKRLMVNIGYKLLAVVVIFTLLRFALPFEFSITSNIRLPAFLSKIVATIRNQFIPLGSFTLSFWSIFEIIWLIGIIILLFKQISIYRKTKQYIILHGKDITFCKPYCSILKQISQEKKITTPFRIIELPGIFSPMLSGIFSPYILIPEKLTLSKEEWYVVLNHEISHFIHHDLVLKKIVHFICIFYWWNPFVYLLRNQADSILEMRIDNFLTKNNRKEIEKYLECLLHIETFAQDNISSPMLRNVALTLCPCKYTQMEQRFYMLCNENKKWTKPKIFLLGITIGIYLLSYLFIFEAYYIPPEDDENLVQSIEEINLYAIYKEDGTYDIYAGSLFIETTDSLQHYPKDIPIESEDITDK